MNTDHPLLRESDDAVITLTLNRPERRNALDKSLDRALRDAFAEIADDDDIRAVILTGVESAFCSGADLKTLEPEPSPDQVHDHLVSRFLPLIDAITTCPKPVVGAINGVAAGAGCALALACDMRLMATDASLLIGFSEIGLVPDMGLSWFLMQEIGYARAFELAALAESVGAEECATLGLVNRTVEPSSLHDEAHALAHALARRPTKALALTKRTLQHAAHESLLSTIRFEAEMQREAARTSDFQEGIRAFREKRSPSFSGK